MEQTAVKISPVNMGARKDIGIKTGDTVRVWQKIEEKGKTRLQAFEGLVLARKHGSEAGATFTVRRVSGGVGIEKIFPLYSPMIDKIEIIKRSKVRRAKLYHIREKVAREIRRQMRKMQVVDITTGSDIEEKTKLEADAEAEKVKLEEAKVAEEAQTQEAEATTNEEGAEAPASSPEEKPVEEATPEAEEKEVKEEDTPAEGEEVEKKG